MAKSATAAYPEMLRFDEFRLDPDGHNLWRGGVPVPLTVKAFQLLVLLVQARPKVLSKTDLHHALWPGTHVSEASLHGLVSELRTALGDNAREPRFVRTVHGYGYAFQGDIVDEPLAAPSAGDSRVRFTLLWGESELPLVEGENVIGRDPDLRVPIPATTVSRRHARIIIAGREARIEDLDSKNGTFVGGDAIGPAPRVLQHGDTIRLGSVAVVFRAIDTMTVTATVVAS
jgi:DNA-binding winged helix-turn-helix (wHTH) protein